MDEIEWKEIDRQNNINFKGTEFKQNFTNSFECNFARIRNIGNNICNGGWLRIPHLEFFGYIYE